MKTAFVLSALLRNHRALLQLALLAAGLLALGAGVGAPECFPDIMPGC